MKKKSYYLGKKINLIWDEDDGTIYKHKRIIKKILKGKKSEPETIKIRNKNSQSETHPIFKKIINIFSTPKSTKKAGVHGVMSAYTGFVNQTTQFDVNKRLNADDALKTNYIKDRILKDHEVTQLINDIIKQGDLFQRQYRYPGHDALQINSNKS